MTRARTRTIQPYTKDLLRFPSIYASCSTTPSWGRMSAFSTEKTTKKLEVKSAPLAMRTLPEPDSND